MLPVILFVLGSTAIPPQDSTFKRSQGENEAELAIPTTVQPTSLFTFGSTIDGQPFQSEQRDFRSKQDRNWCKNQFLCNPEKKSSSTRAFPPVPSKDLVPPFMDFEEEVGITTEEISTTILTETETEKDQLIFNATSVIIGKSSETEKQRNEDLTVKPEAANEVRSYLLPKKLSPAATQIDLSYLPPKNVVTAAASQSVNKVSYLSPLDISPAAAQEDITLLKPENHSKDICSDAFHSFLCTPLRSRKRITGALPDSLTSKSSLFGSLNLAASNTIQSSLRKPKPSVESENEAPSSHPPSTSTTAHYTPLPSNIDKSYLPPVSKSLSASSSFNSIKIANGIHIPTTHKSISTSTARPFDHTSILPYLSPKVIEHFTIAPSKVGGMITTERPKSKLFTNRLFQESSNQFDKEHSSVSPKRPIVSKTTPFATFMTKPKALAVQVFTEGRKSPVTTNSPNYGISPSNIDRSYLPPSSNLESAAAAQVNQAVVAPAPAHHEKHHNHNHGHHHGKDICSDPFHSFLCAPLKQRKRITGAFPSNFNTFSSNNKEIEVKSNEGLKSENTLQTERRLKPAANTVALRTAEHQYPKLSSHFALSSQPPSDRVRVTTVKPNTGYQYSNVSIFLPLSSQQKVKVAVKEDKLAPVTAVLSESYQHPEPPVNFPLPSRKTFDRLKAESTYKYFKPSSPSPLSSQQNVKFVSKDRPKSSFLSPLDHQHRKPSISFALPSQTSTERVRLTTLKLSTGYQFPKPTNPVPLPSQQNIQIVANEDKLSPKIVPSSGYQYPKPSVNFPLPSQTSTDRVRPTTAKPTTGYQYPRPSNPLALPSQQNVQVVANEDKLSPKIVPSSGYQYPKPSVNFPLPSQASTDRVRPTTAKPTTGYQYPRPSNPLALPSQQNVQVVANEDKLSPKIVPSSGYQYPKPSVNFPLPSQASTDRVRPTTAKPTTGYQYPRPSNPLALPSQQNVQVVANEDKLSPKIVPSSGYQYPKPSVNFPLPSQASTDRVRPTTAKPTTGYQYPRPSNPLALPTSEQTLIAKQDRLIPVAIPSSGYQYPKPAISFPTPSEEKSQLLSTGNQRPVIPRPSPSPATGYSYPKPAKPFPLPSQASSINQPYKSSQLYRNLGSAEFIPVNKIDSKRHTEGSSAGGLKFGDRIRNRKKFESLVSTLQ